MHLFLIQKLANKRQPGFPFSFLLLLKYYFSLIQQRNIYNTTFVKNKKIILNNLIQTLQNLQLNTSLEKLKKEPLLQEILIHF